MLEPSPLGRYHRSMSKTALMCPPTFFDVREAKNPYMGSAIDLVKAQQQWEGLRRALEDADVKVELIDPVPNLDDMVFAANQIFVGRHHQIGKFIVPSRMRYPSRQDEVAFFVEWFRQRGYKIIDIDLNGEYLEGHGDLLWHPDHSRIWAAYGFRSTHSGVEKFAIAMREMGFPVVPLQLTDEHCYHLDTCFCPLNNDAVLLYPGAFSADSLQMLRRSWKRVHQLTQDESRQFMGNGIVVNGRFITPRMTDNLRGILAQENLMPVLLDTSEFEKSGGSVFCMKSFID